MLHLCLQAAALPERYLLVQAVPIPISIIPGRLATIPLGQIKVPHMRMLLREVSFLFSRYWIHKRVAQKPSIGPILFMFQVYPIWPFCLIPERFPAQHHLPQLSAQAPLPADLPFQEAASVTTGILEIARLPVQ